MVITPRLCDDARRQRADEAALTLTLTLTLTLSLTLTLTLTLMDDPQQGGLRSERAGAQRAAERERHRHCGELQRDRPRD